MKRYIFVVGKLSEFVDLVNEKMDDYEPLGGPVADPQKTDWMGQAMILRSTTFLESVCVGRTEHGDAVYALEMARQ